MYEFDGKCRTAYGIAVYADSVGHDNTAAVILSFHDISPEKERIEELVRMCNHLNLAPDHLMEVIEDFLAQ